MKKCPRCQTVKAKSEFGRFKDGNACGYCLECARAYSSEWEKANKERRRIYRREYYKRNRERILEQQRGYHRADPRRKKGYRLKETHGLTIDEYEDLLQSQGGRCAVCGQLPKRTSAQNLSLAVDHDHATGAIRGLLCGRCNMTLGQLEEDPDLMHNLIAYVEKWSDA